MNLLCDALDRHLAARRPDYFVGGNMFFYFSLLQTRKNDFRGPDVFIALGVEHRDRKSCVMWEEDGKAPDVIIELTSESTAEEVRQERRSSVSLVPVRVITSTASTARSTGDADRAIEIERKTGVRLRVTTDAALDYVVALAQRLG